VIIAYNFSIDTRFISFFSFGIARVCSTIVVIVTDNIVVNTTRGGVTVSTLTRVFVSAFNWSKDASLCRIARIFGTFVHIVTYD
jgi:hypothetical protein